MRNFKELKIWQKGFDIAIDCFKLTGDFPSEQKFALTSQITVAGFPSHQILQKGAAEAVKKITIDFLKFRLALVLNWKHNY